VKEADDLFRYFFDKWKKLAKRINFWIMCLFFV
jgi:hypothetical protein